MERLAFGYGSSRPAQPSPLSSDGAAVRPTPAGRLARRMRAHDWPFTCLMLFTAALFFRPQDQVPGLGFLPLAELAAIGGLGALMVGHFSGRSPIARTAPELAGVVLLGGLMLLLAPLSIWMGGVVRLFVDMYVKIILIFILMMNALRSPERLDRFVSLILLASGYLAFRAVFDYARGANMIEDYGRVRGAVGGIFGNPNDLALNMVAFMPFALLRAAGSGSALRRLSGAAIAALMAGAVVATGSRSGTLGFAAVVLLGGWHVARRRPGLAFAAALVMVLAMPAVPDSYWERIASITDASKDQSGSRETRSTLFREGWSAFLDRPLTGVGAGQFKNYSPETRRQAWDETHNVMLQVAAELGIVGLLVFSFLIVRALLAGIEVRRLLRRIGSTGGKGSPRPGGPEPLPAVEWKELDAHAAATMVAVAGWLVCGMFASVAYNWTFYYLLALAVAPREFLTERLGRRGARSRYAARVAGAARGVRA